MKKFEAEFKFRSLMPRFRNSRELIADFFESSPAVCLRPSMYGPLPSLYRAYVTANLLCAERVLQIAFPEYRLNLFEEFTTEVFRDWSDMAAKYKELFQQLESLYPPNTLPEIPAERCAEIILDALRESYCRREWYVAPEPIEKDQRSYLPLYPFLLFCDQVLDYWDSCHDNFPEYDDFSMNYVFLPRTNDRYANFFKENLPLNRLETFAPAIAAIEGRVAQIDSYYAWRRTRKKPLMISGKWIGAQHGSSSNNIQLEFQKDATLRVTYRDRYGDLNSIRASYIFTDDNTIRTTLAIGLEYRITFRMMDGPQLVLHYSPEKITFVDPRNRARTYYPEAKS